MANEAWLRWLARPVASEPTRVRSPVGLFYWGGFGIYFRELGLLDPSSSRPSKIPTEIGSPVSHLGDEKFNFSSAVSLVECGTDQLELHLQLPCHHIWREANLPSGLYNTNGYGHQGMIVYNIPYMEISALRGIQFYLMC
jgi:hypothetical protein